MLFLFTTRGGIPENYPLLKILGAGILAFLVLAGGVAAVINYTQGCVIVDHCKVAK